jgi:nicotinate-nucleotide adenylyltransferase
MKKVGVYGGSFDPIHFGHLNLALEMMEKHQLDEVCFYPSKINPNKFDPNKPGGGFASEPQRLQMVKLALENIPGLSFSVLEYERPAPSFTVDTLRDLTEHVQEETQFFLILGQDAAAHFFQWHQPEEIIKLARPLVGMRQQPIDLSALAFQGSLQLVQALRQGLTQTRVMQISSSEVRQRLSERFYCGHLVPAKVLDYIISHQLYLSSLNSKNNLS